MNRREFLKRAYQIGGLTALLSLGIKPETLNSAVLQGIMASASKSGAASCPADGSPDVTLDGNVDYVMGIGHTTDRYYVGTFWTATADVAVCKVGFKLSDSGTAQNYVYTATICRNSDNVVIDTSDTTYTWNEDLNATWKYFSFTSNPALANTVKYRFCLSKADAGDDTNYVSICYTNQAAGGPEDLQSWTSIWGNTMNNTDYDGNIKIFFYD